MITVIILNITGSSLLQKQLAASSTFGKTKLVGRVTVGNVGVRPLRAAANLEIAGSRIKLAWLPGSAC